ncbi:glutamine synthetase family protein [Gulosibacter sp. 10]|uniref:glutamine synthetase family protein n=1 Tax=Gulosibacter sp. 10 TaxID=1255570 RepID=UPI00097EFBCD|nr:glutamine synthetase family protein [Gulosibacter sp. 10]SJM60336.1 Glutamine synthetase, putative [Gulosibacter sp. 10]
MPQESAFEPLEDVVFIATSDLAARTKGRALPARRFDETTSVGWVPANIGIGPLGHIVDGIPFGASGDLRLRPDPASRVRIPRIGERPAFDLVFGDLVEVDGEPWHSCPRTFLRETVRELREEFGIEARSTFEHEFVDLSAGPDHHPFSLEAFRRAEPLGSTLLALLERMGLEPENWLPEYAKHQYEITLEPTDPLTSADRAILLRDLVRDLFEAHGRRATFAPITEEGGGGSGVHVHFGLYDESGRTLLFDPDRPGRLSELGGRFAAGVIRHAPGLTALFAPLLTSYQRLRPHNWSTARAFLGVQNREALLRICPTNELDGRDPSRQLHFEFRGSDAGANPWLLLGALLRAGMAGLRESLDPAEVVEGDLDLEGRHAGLAPLPERLEDALDAMLADETVTGWFSPELVETFAAIKRDELRLLRSRSLAEQIEVYSRVL